MNAGTIRNTYRRLTVLTVAALLALVSASAPVLLDGATGTALTPSVFACDPQGHGGGGC